MAPPDADALISHAGFVRDLAYRLLRDAHEAEDVVQQVFLTAMRRPPETNRPLRPWLRRVARNLAIDAHRSRGRRQQSERIAALDAVDPRIEPTSLDTAKSELAANVLALAEPYRTAVLLRYYDELSPGAIARRLDVPVETVRTRIKRGVAQLRGRLHGQDEEKRELWAGVLVRLAKEPRRGASKPSRWSPAIYLPLAASLGAISVWLWQGASPANSTPTIAEAAAPGFEARPQNELVPQEAAQRPLPPVEEAQLLRVRIVTDEGVLVPDARVDVYVGGQKVAEARTDRNGEMQVSRTPGVELELRVGMTRISLAHSTEVPGELAAASDELRVVHVPSASSLSGRVVDADGFPVPFARVAGWFGTTEEDWRSRTPDQLSTADANGSFALLGLPRQFRVEAYWAHLVARETYVAHLEKATELQDVELHVCESRTVRGQVVDEFGIAVADAEVRTLAANDTSRDPDAPTKIVPRDGDVVKTARDGTFIMTGIPPAPTSLVIDEPNYAPHIIPPPPPGGVDPGDEVEIGLQVGVGLDITVTDGQGRPIRNAEAHFFMISGGDRREASDIAGRIRLEHLPAGCAGFLRVDANDREPHVREIKKLGRKGQHFDVSLALPRVIRGYVLDERHYPIRGAKVTARLLDTPAGSEDPAWRAARDAASFLGVFITASDGHFVFPCTPWRAFRLDIRTPSGVHRTFEVDYNQVTIECTFDTDEGAGASSH